MGEHTAMRPKLLAIFLAAFCTASAFVCQPCSAAASFEQTQNNKEGSPDKDSGSTAKEPRRDRQDPRKDHKTNSERGKGGRGDHHRSSRTGDPFFGAVREIFLADADLQMYAFAIDKRVSDHLQLSGESRNYLKQQLTGYFGKMSDWKEEYLADPSSIEGLRDAMRTEADLARTNMQKHLSQQEKLKDLFSLYIQARGAIAAAVKPIADEIGLAGEGLQKFRQAKEEAWHDMMDKLRDEMRHILRQPVEDRRDHVTRLHRHAARQLELTLSRELGEDLRQALDKLAGEELPNIQEFQRLRRLPFAGPGRGPGGPPPNRGGSGRRPPGEGNPPRGDP